MTGREYCGEARGRILCRCRRISEGLNQMAQGLQSQTPS